MSIFPRGYIWPAASGTPQSLTNAFVASSVEFEVHQRSRLFCLATLGAGGVEDPGLLVRVDVSFDSGALWQNGYKYIAVPGLGVGVHAFFVDIPTNWHSATWRISCRDILGNVNTTISVWAEAIDSGADHVSSSVEDQPIELYTARTTGVLAWHDGSGAADALTTNFALGPTSPAQWIPVGRANELEIWATTSGGPATSVEIQVDESCDDGSTVGAIPAINSITDGVVNLMPGQVQLQSASGTIANGVYVSHRVPLQPGSWIRLQAKRTGAAVSLLAYARLFRV